jgi:cell division topological specificity factor
MIEWLKRIFGQPGSGATAKERLRLVLMTDHLSLAPEMIEAMKRDFVDVISKYVEVDRDKVEVTFEREDRALAMLANIPIVSVGRPNGGNGVAEAPPANASATVTAAVEESTETPAPQPPPRRKRRKRQVKQQPAPAQ